MEKVALVVKLPQGKQIEDPQNWVTDHVDSKVMGDADYILTWEQSEGFTVLQHPLDVDGSKKGFVSAPDVHDENLQSRVRFLLDGPVDLKVWLTVT